MCKTLKKNSKKLKIVVSNKLKYRGKKKLIKQGDKVKVSLDLNYSSLDLINIEATVVEISESYFINSSKKRVNDSKVLVKLNKDNTSLFNKSNFYTWVDIDCLSYLGKSLNDDYNGDLIDEKNETYDDPLDIYDLAIRLPGLIY